MICAFRFYFFFLIFRLNIFFTSSLYETSTSHQIARKSTNYKIIMAINNEQIKISQGHIIDMHKTTSLISNAKFEYRSAKFDVEYTI